LLSPPGLVLSEVLGLAGEKSANSLKNDPDKLTIKGNLSLTESNLIEVHWLLFQQFNNVGAIMVFIIPWHTIANE